MLIRWLLLCWLAALLVACAPIAGYSTDAPAESFAEASVAESKGKETGVEPEAIAARLTGTATLDEAAAQLAAALGVQPDRVRVRIQDSRCSVCNVQARAQLGSLDGLSAEEAAPLIDVNATFWLVVDDLVCEYALREAVYTPQACRIAP